MINQYSGQTLRDWLSVQHQFMKNCPDYDGFFKDTPDYVFRGDLEKRIFQIHHIFEHCKINSNSKILDIGMGGGQIPHLLSKMGLEVYGLDDIGASRGEKSLNKRHPGVKCKVCALENDPYPFHEETFDLITSLDTI